MKAKIELEATKREKLGRGAARELRRAKRVPAIIYSNKLQPVSISLAWNELTREYNKGAFRSKLLKLNVGKENYYALAREIQTHPVTDLIEHVDFLQVDKDSTVTVAVPVKIFGREKSVGLRRGGALNIVRHTVKLVCTPESIPTSIKVDISQAMIGDSIHISEVDLPEGVKPAIEGRDFTIVSIAGRQKEEVVAETADSEAEDAADAEGADADSEETSSEE